MPTFFLFGWLNHLDPYPNGARLRTWIRIRITMNADPNFLSFLAYIAVNIIVVISLHILLSFLKLVCLLTAVPFLKILSLRLILFILNLNSIKDFLIIL